MRKQDLFLNCLRGTVDAYRGGVFNRYDTVACMATCIDIHMRQLPATERADAAAIPTLELNQPLNDDDRVLQELYAEATTFWAAGYGRLRLIK